MKRIENKTITTYRGPWWPRTVGGVELVGCTLQDCSIGYRHSRDFKRRTIVKDVVIKDCQISTCHVNAAQLEEIHLENIFGGNIFILGALFKHVRMKGKFDVIVIHGTPEFSMRGENQRRYWTLCDQYYADSDWALDISEAEFADFSIRTRGIPSHLVRRDPETQVIVKKENIVEGRWRSLGVCKLVETDFKLWENEGGEDLIIVAPKRRKDDFTAVMADIRRLREAGIAEPN